MGIPNLTTFALPEITPTVRRNHEISGRDSSDGSGLCQRGSGVVQKTQHTQRTASGPENTSTEHRAAGHRNARSLHTGGGCQGSRTGGHAVWSRTLHRLAPTNDAFAKIPSAALNDLLADKDALTAVLLRHVVPSSIKAAQIPAGTTAVATAGGEKVDVVN